MSEKNDLLLNIEKIHTTKMGADRIRRNLAPDTADIADVVLYCKQKILDEKCNIRRCGKNYYCTADGMTITVNAYSFTIITAHKET